MNCNKCGTANDAGSKFCKECGEKLTEFTNTKMLTTDEHLKVGEFVYLAYRESEAGHLDRAIEACQGALAINDANPAIHTLLGSIYERKGDLARAIYEYERVVSLNPGSLDDRRKLEQLRMQLISPASIISAPPRRGFQISDIRWPQGMNALMPYAAAAIVFVIVVVLAGNLLLKSPASRVDSRGVGNRGRTQAVSGPNSGYQQGPTDQYGNPNGMGAQEATGQPTTQPNATATPTPTRPGIPSVRVPGSATAPQRPASTSSAKPSERTPSGSTSPKPVIQPIIRPTETAVRPKPTNTSPITPLPEPTRPAQPARNAEERGRELQSMGKYDQAIDAYREALNQTSDSGRVYQHIAMSYQRKGEHDAAIDNYNRAIKAYRDQLATGRSRTEVESGIRACEAGIEVSRNRK